MNQINEDDYIGDDDYGFGTELFRLVQIYNSNGRTGQLVQHKKDLENSLDNETWVKYTPQPDIDSIKRDLVSLSKILEEIMK